MDLVEYAARGVPELSLEKLANYQPRKPDEGATLAGKMAPRYWVLFFAMQHPH
jgi:hypothetical protein